MKDIKITTVSASLPVNQSVSIVSQNPIVIRITGQKFDQAKSVFLNDINIPNFIIENQTSMRVPVPDSLPVQNIKSVTVLTDSFEIGRGNIVYFDLSHSVRSINGIQKLIQHFLKILLQAPFSNLFDPVGGGLLKLVGTNMNSNTGEPALSELIDAINRTKNYMLKKQASNKKIPLDERMMNVTIEGASVGNDKQSIHLSLTITNMLGQGATTIIKV